MEVWKELINQKRISEEEKTALFEYWENKLHVLPDFIEWAIEEENAKNFRPFWYLDHFFNKHPKYFFEMEDLWVDALKRSKTDSGRRSILRVLAKVKSDYGKNEGFLLNFCMDSFQNSFSPIAVRANAMLVIQNILPKYPELGREITLILDEYPPNQSAGFYTRAKMLRKTIAKINKSE
jgi:hypothetical protein